MNLVEAERLKYDEVWSLDDYHRFSPGVDNVKRFMEVLEPRSGETLVDIGCGTGAAGLLFQNDHRLVVRWLDITDSALDPAINVQQFILQPVWGRWNRPRGFDYGFCCDVMEHIPTEFVMLSLSQIITNCRTSWFQICNLPDNFGATFGRPLHLTIQPFTWWLERLRMLGNVTDARDLCGVSMYVVKR
jgi:2-polyprenyl-3-methyl-5-hydroxy-6-metoxy-1,4-benzoquinol methylase